MLHVASSEPIAAGLDAGRVGGTIILKTILDAACVGFAWVGLAVNIWVDSRRSRAQNSKKILGTLACNLMAIFASSSSPFVIHSGL